jgi:hypothetical protein
VKLECFQQAERDAVAPIDSPRTPGLGAIGKLSAVGCVDCGQAREHPPPSLGRGSRVLLPDHGRIDRSVAPVVSQNQMPHYSTI